MKASAYIVGCGTLGRALARRLTVLGHGVTALVRRPEQARALAAEGVTALCVDLDRRSPPPVDADWLFYLAPPPGRGVGDPRLGRFLAAQRPAPPQALVLVSSTAVYGDHGGAWVDESSPTRPGDDRGRRRLDAERRARAAAAHWGARWAVLRVAGIYGPGRLPEARLRRGEPVLRPELSPPSNRIHEADLVDALVAAAERGEGVYNAADGHPTTMTDYFDRCADLLGLPRPPRIDWAEAERRLSPAMLSYLRSTRRVANDRLLELLGRPLRYPDLSHGLPACLPGAS